ncbi:MAG: response regulator [Synechococcales cyanobacterium K44_A2020_017]|uniref:response regulator transcription factor n=1 Tax=Leptolyngbya sp. CCY15150 TaxID=2767772 RepID=UPI00194FA064|nr:response regulator [Leptolyngbya sp. CCY15150]MBF2089110.1 response regulator [Synechococcales cyanobacterium K32_A2020_035]MBF2095668.1 response regulator [Synechococcales cyanobacterium K44_A2020_017]
MTTILVIEDQQPIRENIAAILETEGYNVIGAKDGSFGLRLVREKQPDLIVCDIMMPGIDGYGVLNALRHNPMTAAIPFIFLSARTDKLDQRQGMNLGADDYLTKPFTRHELLDSIRARLQKHTMIMKRSQSAQRQTSYLEEKLTALEEHSIESDRLLEQFSDEFSGLISNINLVVQLLSDRTANDVLDRYLKVLKEECHRGVELLNQHRVLPKLVDDKTAKLLDRFNELMG